MLGISTLPLLGPSHPAGLWDTSFVSGVGLRAAGGEGGVSLLSGGETRWKGLSRPARPLGRGVRPSVGFLRPQPPFPLRQEPPWFPRSRVPSLAWPAAVSHSAEGGWGFPFLGGRASAGTPPQGQSGPGPPLHPRVGPTPGPARRPSHPSPFPVPSCGHRPGPFPDVSETSSPALRGVGRAVVILARSPLTS